MEPFHAENPCPRCASAGTSYKLHSFPCADVGADGEHVHRQCPACGHEWAEAPRPLRIVGYTDGENVSSA